MALFEIVHQTADTCEAVRKTGSRDEVMFFHVRGRHVKIGENNTVRGAERVLTASSYKASVREDESDSECAVLCRLLLLIKGIY